MKFIFTVVFVFLSFLCVFSQDQSDTAIEPGKIWYDTCGNPINAHAGGMLHFEGAYYWFGQIMIPGRRGSDAWVGVSCYASEDLYHWKYQGVAFQVNDHASHQVTRGCKIERPKVIYNKKTKKFVMWWHHDINGQGHRNAMAGIAVSDSVAGPYELIRIFRPLAGYLPENIPSHWAEAQSHPMAHTYAFTGGDLPLHADSLRIFKRDFHEGQMCRDMTLFVDDDEKAYHIYASEENSTLHIAELSDDYLGYTGRYIRVFPGRFMEAPALFKSDNTYYLIASGCTGWAPNAARSARAPSIYGPWTEMKNPCVDAGAEITYDSQSTFVLPVKNKQNALIFMADRWNPDNPIDARYVWLPIQMKGNQPVIEWMERWDLSFFDHASD